MSILHKFRGFLGIAMPIILCVMVAGQVAPAGSDSHVAEHSTRWTAIGNGDLVQLSVLGAPEFQRDLRVSDSGQISLPMAGNIPVAGLSVEDAQNVIAKKLVEAGLFVDPQVTLLVKEYASLGISVLGEVQKPGIYPLLGSHTLFDAISAAGGTTAKAGQAVTISHRGQPEKTETVMMTNGPDGKTTGNVRIFPGDTIVVSKAGMVYVVGDVRQPTGIVLDSTGLTVLQAISIAQGTNSTAALDNTRVLRRSANGTQEIAVPLKDIMSAKSHDIALQPEDVLFVPKSAAKGAAFRTMEAILQAATGIVIYRR